MSALAWSVMGTAISLDTFLLGIALGLHLSGTTLRQKEVSEPRATTSVALAAVEETPIDVDDARMLCPTCWENRHPGLRWFLRERVLCHEHAAIGTAETREGNDQKHAVWALPHV